MKEECLGLRATRKEYGQMGKALIFKRDCGLCAKCACILFCDKCTNHVYAKVV